MMSDRNWLALPRVAIVLAAVLVLLVLGPILSAPDPELEPSGRPGVALNPWDLIGCWQLRYEGWGAVDAPLADRPSGPGGAPGGTLTPPGVVMLLPDSVDAWGRMLPSYRAAQLDDGVRERRSLRWLVEADTLWLLWSEGGARAGAALRSSGDSLLGSVRAVRGARGAADGDSLDLNARAAALRINCATRQRETKPERPPR